MLFIHWTSLDFPRVSYKSHSIPQRIYMYTEILVLCMCLLATLAMGLLFVLKQWETNRYSKQSFKSILNYFELFNA